MKKLEKEFERKRRDHDEQMRQLEDELQIKMLEAELETFSGEQSDGSKPSSESESEVEKRSTAARSLKSDESEEYAENRRVSLPRQDLFLSTKTHKTNVQQLEGYRKQCSPDEDYENLIEYDTELESTPIRSFCNFNRHDTSRDFVSSQMSSARRISNTWTTPEQRSYNFQIGYPISSETDKDRIDSKCPLCNADHRFWNCEKFQSMKTQDRYNVAMEKKRLCFDCLSDNHVAKASPRKQKGGIDNCKKTHNKRLH